MPTPNIYSEDWRVANEVPTINDAEHDTARTLNLTVAGCNCRRCCNLRDISRVGMSPFGREDEQALKAMDRMLARTTDGR